MDIYKNSINGALVLLYVILGVFVFFSAVPALINGSFLTMAVAPFVIAVYIVIGFYLKKFIFKKG